MSDKQVHRRRVVATICRLVDATKEMAKLEKTLRRQRSNKGFIELEIARRKSELAEIKARIKREARWSDLRLCIGYSSVVLVFVITLVGVMVLFGPVRFPEFIVKAAGTALFANGVNIIAGVWKVVLNARRMSRQGRRRGLE
jgi:hypothetical protein